MGPHYLLPAAPPLRRHGAGRARKPKKSRLIYYPLSKGERKARAIAPEPLNIYSGMRGLLSRSNSPDSASTAESFTSRRRRGRSDSGEERDRKRRGVVQRLCNFFCVFICSRFCRIGRSTEELCVFVSVSEETLPVALFTFFCRCWVFPFHSGRLALSPSLHAKRSPTCRWRPI